MKKQIAVMNALDGFSCLGSECTHNCCQGWEKFVVDADTLEKWNNIDDEAKRYLMNLVSTGDDISVMKKTKENNCIALNDKKLCSIQLRFGHDYLPRICQNFPRINYQNHISGYKSASLACPDIVDKTLFDNSLSMYSVIEAEDTSVQESSYKNKLLCDLDIFLTVTLEKTEYPVGLVMFFISDMFHKIINMYSNGEMTEGIIHDLQDNIDIYLSDISKAIKSGKLKPHPVTAGSFWKNIYELCEKNKINRKFLDNDSATLLKSIHKCDDSFASLSKIYAGVNQYKKKANKQIKNKYNLLFRKYIKIIFINKGFPLSNKHVLDLNLVDCMINISVLQLLVWIEVNKNDKLSTEFLKECVIEVDRKFVQHDGVVNYLKNDPPLMQIDKYCPSFLDVF